MNAPAFELRAARAADAPVLAGFNCAMARETEGLALDPETVAAGVAALFTHPQHGFYTVAEAGDALVGALLVTKEWSDWRNGLFWWLQSVYVRPDWRRRGVYRALYRHVREQARAAPGVCGFRLYVERDNQRARRTYESLGMVRTPYLMYEASTRDGGDAPRS